MSNSITEPVAVVIPSITDEVTINIPSITEEVNVGPSPDRFSVTLNNSMAGFTLPLVNTSTYDFVVFWGDGTADHITTWNQVEATHNYPTNGSYTLTVRDGGTMPRWFFNNAGSKLKILTLNNWGSGSWSSLRGMFNGCSNLTSVASGGDFALVTDFTATFSSCSSLTSVPPISYATGTTFIQTFLNCTGFVTFPAINFTLGTDFTELLLGCSNLVTVGACNFHGGALTRTFGTAGTPCSALTSVLATGISQDVSFVNCNMAAPALNTLYTNLSTVVGKTIDVTGNPGEAGSTKSIATLKGWTVVP